ncbi:Lrp/AsnC family transcriptional regulator [uncultured Ferrovibrio sp.]|jgi:DNA-binding Lrp family transcriptional regulator|uniref:Lrp/AsnC family transcriptional regulator n=1 Tax=uncultured Ferrovibrio sp. TaxID=1576913 RepID=UPI00262F14BC|nr:Lrp/AsnC family transcriptional regulator [uncultured Ferrovibrio sp.]
MMRDGVRDELDRQLIALLQANARQSTMALAKKLGLARSTVHERIRRLEREGVIRGYMVRLGRDPFAEYAQAIALLALAQRQQRNVVERLAKLPEIKLCYTISGDSDLFLLLEAPRLEDLDALIDEIVGQPGVERCRSFIVLSQKIDRKGDGGS